MKRIILTSALILFVFSASSVVGGPEPGEGEMAITNEGSSASGSTAVGPNGTSYSTFFSVVNRSSTLSELGANNMTGVIDSGFEEDKLSFTGIVETPTPCYSLNHSVTEVGDGEYQFQVNSEEENGTCTQVLAYHKYNASFQTDSPSKVEVFHGNNSTETLTHPDYDTSGPDPKPQPENNKNPISAFINWFKGLFSNEPEQVTYQGDELEGHKIEVEPK
ncbi:hypothetical protein [Candidatus Nanohalobium constans]|uniref:Uncharacterized protein n=1 Tax=Candidatus Nanohalobium constans TaxID=2565781 RepID=A0A5Q0UFZ5_9ARCH|nr:hypothetical protein [Candidatus Nanohalobium constans]QGA80517.1 hypothetical protein LC1Nh_0624 [Candidatus Nanohalobium constans]